jgi:hypothetical protein
VLRDARGEHCRRTGTHRHPRQTSQVRSRPAVRLQRRPVPAPAPFPFPFLSLPLGVVSSSPQPGRANNEQAKKTKVGKVQFFMLVSPHRATSTRSDPSTCTRTYYA